MNHTFMMNSISISLRNMPRVALWAIFWFLINFKFLMGPALTCIMVQMRTVNDIHVLFMMNVVIDIHNEYYSSQ